MKKRQKKKSTSAISPALYYMTQAQRDRILAALARILRVDKITIAPDGTMSGMNFPSFISTAVNQVADEETGAGALKDALMAATKAHAEQLDEKNATIEEKNKLLRVVLPSYLKSIG